MILNHFSFAAVVSGFISVSTLAMAVGRPDLEGVESCLPTHISSKDFVEEALGEAPTIVVPDEDKEDCDFGFTFPYIVPPLRWIMEEINSRYEDNGERPLVFDAGAGAGYATWKMIAAGGQVIPLELNKKTAKSIMASLKKVRQFLQEGEKITDTCPCVLTGSVMNFNSPAYTYNYDGAYVGNLLHFLTPDQSVKFVSKLYSVVKPGGFVAAIVNTPSFSDSVVDTWRQAYDQGKDFPGYMMHNSQILRRAYDSFQQNVGVRLEEARSFEEGDLLPGRVHKGSFAEPSSDDKPNWLFVREDVDNRGRFKEFLRYEHRTTHFMDSSTLRKLFENAGFITHHIYYMDTFPRCLSPEEITDEMLKNGQFNVGIEVYKPENAPKEGIFT